MVCCFNSWLLNHFGSDLFYLDNLGHAYYKCMLFTTGSAFMRTSPPPVVQRAFPRACFPQLLLHLPCSAPPCLLCSERLAFSSMRQVQTHQERLRASWRGQVQARLPCLGGARRKPGKGTPVRVGTLPMKSECVHTKALTPGRGGSHDSQRQHRTKNLGQYRLSLVRTI